jgi:hypothetical protein
LENGRDITADLPVFSSAIRIDLPRSTPGRYEFKLLSRAKLCEPSKGHLKDDALLIQHLRATTVKCCADRSKRPRCRTWSAKALRPDHNLERPMVINLGRLEPIIVASPR